MGDKIEYGYCHCGCGKKTLVPTKNSKSKNWVKGVPMPYCRGHYNKHHGISEAQKKQLSESRKGSNNPAYKGGVVFDKTNNTYLVLTELGYIPRSWKVYYDKYNVYPKEDEVIIHLNGDSTDDNIDNLKLITKSEFGRLHFEIHEVREKSDLNKAGEKGGAVTKERYGNEYYRIIPFLSGLSYKELYGINEEDFKK